MCLMSLPRCVAAKAYSSNKAVKRAVNNSNMSLPLALLSSSAFSLTPMLLGLSFVHYFMSASL